MSLDTVEAKRRIAGWFPALGKNDFHITSPEDRRYNCVAWAAEDMEEWWWPDPDYGYWPPDSPRTETVEAFMTAFSHLGYVACETGVLEEGFIKIAIYADPQGIPTHTARQLADGTWTSKLGPCEDISHETAEGLEGAHPAYGSVRQFMARPIDFP